MFLLHYLFSDCGGQILADQSLVHIGHHDQRHANTQADM